MLSSSFLQTGFTCCSKATQAAALEQFVGLARKLENGEIDKADIYVARDELVRSVKGSRRCRVPYYVDCKGNTFTTM